MNAQNVQLSRSLEAVAKALAHWTVDRHAQADPALPGRYGATWHADWVANIASRIAYLAQAIAVGSPAVFAESMRWNRDAALSRNGNVQDLERSLHHMAAVIAAELPAPLAAAAGECVAAALHALAQPNSREPVVALDSPHRELILRYLELVLAGEREKAIACVVDRAAAGVSIPEIYTQVLHPAQTELGRLWHRGEITIATEHYATATTHFLMTRLRPYVTVIEPRRLRVMAAAVGGDFHEIGIRTVAECFELSGWEVMYFGANLPASEAVREVAEFKPHVLAISASTYLHLRDLAELIQAVRDERECENVRLLIGGPPFNRISDLWKSLGADGYSKNAMEGVRLAEQWMGTKDG